MINKNEIRNISFLLVINYNNNNNNNNNNIRFIIDK